MKKEVSCPQCGQRVGESALEAHLRLFCRSDPGTTHSPKPTTHTRMDAIAPGAAGSVEALLSQLSMTGPAQDASAETVVTEPPTRHVFQPEEAIPVPPQESYFWLAPKHEAVLRRVAALSAEGTVANVLLLGPAGCGKTTLPRHFAATERRPFFEIHCGSLMDVEQWFGKDRLVDGETLYRKSRFVQALETPHCVVLLDEINRAHPELLNGIFGLLDWRRSIYSDDLGYMVRVAEGVTFFATMNEGADFYGTNPLDMALRDRFPRVLRLSYPPASQEETLLVAMGVDADTAGRLAHFGTQLRNATVPIAISPRQLQTASEEMRLGATLREAVELSIVNRLDDPQMEKQALEALQLVDPDPYVEQDEEGYDG